MKFKKEYKLFQWNFNSWSIGVVWVGYDLDGVLFIDITFSLLFLTYIVRLKEVSNEQK